MPSHSKAALKLAQAMMQRVAFAGIIAGTLSLLAATVLASFGALPWLEFSVLFGEIEYPEAGRFFQIGVTALAVMPCFFLPSNVRIMRLENSHRHFAINLEDVAHAYRRPTPPIAPVPLLCISNSMPARLVHLNEHPDLSEDDLDRDWAKDENEAEAGQDDDHDTAGRAGRLGPPASDGRHGAQVTRIFNEADTQLEEPESNKRRNAIQHLRAAVAATKAERRAGGAMELDVDDKPYRNDLQSAVRPRRPQLVASTATPRPSANPPARPAPLKLVAKQRSRAVK